jgi:hypothetical protein
MIHPVADRAIVTYNSMLTLVADMQLDSVAVGFTGKGMHYMKNFLIAVGLVLALGSTAYGRWYVGPPVVYPYYAAAPVYVAPAPVPYTAYSPVIAAPPPGPAPVWVGPPVVVGPAGKVYIVGRPVRNAVRAVLP